MTEGELQRIVAMLAELADAADLFFYAGGVVGKEGFFVGTAQPSQALQHIERAVQKQAEMGFAVEGPEAVQ